MNQTSLYIYALFFAFSVAACGNAEDETAEHADSLVGICKGKFECSADADSFEFELKKEGSTCRIDAGTLNPDGTATSREGEKKLTWTGTIFEFDLCLDNQCVTCSNQSPPLDVPGYACRGSASSCGGLGASSCATQEGCYYSLGSTLSSNDDSCNGSADSCSSIDGPTLCKWQRGCSWKRE